MSSTWRTPALRLAAAVTVSATLLLAGCAPVTRPSIKLGLVAPFEGRYREVGYEVIYAVRLAVREANAAGGMAGYSVELVALDDSGDPAQAEVQARKLAADTQVVAGIGHWLEPTTLAAAPVYAELGFPLLATAAGRLPEASFRLWPAEAALAAAGGTAAQHCPAPCDQLEDLTWLDQARAAGPTATIVGPPLWGQPQFAALAGAAAEGVLVAAPAPLPADSADPGFADRYRAVSGGVEPRINAVLAYDATRVVLAAIERAAGSDAPTRATVSEALRRTDYMGLSGQIRFTAEGDRDAARVWLYRWHDGALVLAGQ